MNSTENSDEYALIEALIVDNPELEKLESLLEQFNIFEALGAVRVELRHSDFLAFLLNPNQNHGLDDQFLKRLLQRALADAQLQSPIRPIDLDIADLDSVLVLREWQNIDILLLDEENGLAVIIENKIYSNEHSNQLQRYQDAVSQHYPQLRQICLFLSPEGIEPSHEDYIAIDYGQVADLVETLVETRASTIGPDVRTLMTHYSHMLRRHIVSESEIAELCRKIYRKHQRALDLIYEYRPDLQEGIRDILEGLIASEPELIQDHSTKSSIRFSPREWDDLPKLAEGTGWTTSGRLLLFEFGNYADRLALYLVLGPGPVEIRQKLLDVSKEYRPLKPAFGALGKQFNTLYKYSFLTARDYDSASLEDIEPEINKKWSQFLERELPAIKMIIQQQEWL